MKEFTYKFYELFNPTIRALQKLGGSGSVSEIEDYVIEDLKLSDEEINDIHRGTTTKLNYRLRWARNYLKNFGILVNSERGIWALNSKGLKTTKVDPKEVMKKVREVNKNSSATQNYSEDEPQPIINTDEADLKWKYELLAQIKNIPASSFERLCQRFLRELGFINVEVTGKPNDGGIDGRGILRLGGVLSFHVAFQAKRYKDTVGPDVIRDFRGSMSVNVDKGLVITTGRFTREARKEAQRDGAIPIDLIDGDELVEKLKELKLFVTIEMVEKVSIETDWQKNI